MKKSVSCWLRSVLILLLFICSILLIIVLILVILNTVSPDSTNSSCCLSCASDWVVAVATFLAAIFAGSAFLYSKFISRFQAENAVFSQMYSQQNVVVNNCDYNESTVVLSRRRKIKLSGNAYALFRKFIVRKKYKFDNDLRDMADIWTDFSSHLICRRSSTLSPAFKYLHDEITWVSESEAELLDQEKKKSYVSLVQSQLNYDQLLCYMFNLARYKSVRYADPRTDAYISLLRDSKFFENLYDSSDYRNILKKYVKRSVLEIFISKDYIDEVDNRI